MWQSYFLNEALLTQSCVLTWSDIMLQAEGVSKDELIELRLKEDWLSLLCLEHPSSPFSFCAIEDELERGQQSRDYCSHVDDK